MPEVQFINHEFAKIVAELNEERTRQDTKWGEQNHDPFTWLVIEMEEIGEASEAILHNEINRYRLELIQVAAVAIAAIECLDRAKMRVGPVEG